MGACEPRSWRPALDWFPIQHASWLFILPAPTLYADFLDPGAPQPMMDPPTEVLSQLFPHQKARSSLISVLFMMPCDALIPG